MSARLRDRALERLLPPLVHRLNNAIAVFQGAFELGSGASPRDRANAQKELEVLSASLARLALFAGTPSVRTQVLALESLGRTCTLLLEPLARALKLDFTVRTRASLTVRADEGLERLLLLTSYELIEALAAQAGEPRELRLTLDARPGRALLTLTARSPLGLPGCGAELAEYARQRGFGFTRRALARGTGLRLTLPGLHGPVLAPVRASRPQRRVLLLQADGQDRELAATLLREQGCEVREAAVAPETGDYELVLLDEELVARDPALLARLGHGPAFRRLERIRPPLRPAQLLEFLSS